MATCQIDKISVVCEGGCGLICSGSQCWSWCEPVSSPTVIPAVMLLQAEEIAEADRTVEGSTMLTLCTKGGTRRSLGHVLEKMVGQRLLTSDGDGADVPVEPFSGSLDELLSYHGFRRENS